MRNQQRNAEIASIVVENAALYTAIRRLDPAVQIRSLMRRKGLQNNDLAERIGVSTECISRWLKGSANVQIDTLYKLADALEEPLTILIGDQAQLSGTVEDVVDSSKAEMTVLLAEGRNPFACTRLPILNAANDDDNYIEKDEVYEAVPAFA